MKRYSTTTLGATCALCVLFSSSALAGSAGSATSSASSAGSASLHGSSASIETSSNGVSSVSGRDKTAMIETGHYRVAGVATDPQQRDILRLTLTPLTQQEAGDFVLKVPAAALEQVPAAGDLIHAQKRDYGIQFSRVEATQIASSQKPFFLVLADTWNTDLNSTPVTP